MRETPTLRLDCHKAQFVASFIAGQGSANALQAEAETRPRNPTVTECAGGLRLVLLIRRLCLLTLALALTACSAIELRQQMANATPTATESPADTVATIDALEAAVTEAAATLVALKTAAATPVAATALATTSESVFASAEAFVYGSVPIDSDRLNTIAALAFDSAGQLLVSTRAGDIYRLRDADADGLADDSRLIFADEQEALLHVTGLITRGDNLILRNGDRLSQLQDSDADGIYDTVTQLANNLPAGESPLLAGNGIVEAPDGRLFSADLNTGEILQILLQE